MFIENRIKELSTRTDLILSKGKKTRFKKRNQVFPKKRVKRKQFCQSEIIKNNLNVIHSNSKRLIREQVYTKVYTKEFKLIRA